MGKWKIVLIGFVFLISISTGAIYFYIKTTSKEIVIDPDIEEIIETQYTFELPEERETSPFLKEEIASNEEENAPPISSESKTVHSNKKPAHDNSSMITPEVILEQYQPTFESLEVQVNQKIDALVDRAVSEYTAKKQTGEEVSLTYLYQKYSAAANNLEAKTDQTFSYILSAIETDLERHGFGVEHAEKYQELYEDIKKERRAELLKKAKERVL